MDSVPEDSLWPSIVMRIGMQNATTNVDGKYEIDGVHGGRFYLHAIHATDLRLVEWLVPVDIDDNGSLEVNLYNANANLIINKSL